MSVSVRRLVLPTLVGYGGGKLPMIADIGVIIAMYVFVRFVEIMADNNEK